MKATNENTKEPASENDPQKNKRASVERRKTSLPPILKSKEQERDEWVIRTLPENWVVDKKPSTRIEYMIQKRKTEHENTIRKMKEKMVDVNTEIETKIRLEGEYLKTILKNAQKEASLILGKLVMTPTDLLALHKMDFEDIEERLNAVANVSKQKIEYFHAFLNSLEQGRSDDYKKVLKAAYENLHNIYYKLPHELQEFFELEILNINQILLNNLRSYSDLCLTLELQIENTVRQSFQHLIMFKDRWKELKKEAAMESIRKARRTQLSMCVSRVSSIASKTSAFSDGSNKFGASWTAHTTLPNKVEDVHELCMLTDNALQEMDAAAKMLVDVYKTAILQICKGCFTKLSDLTKSFNMSKAHRDLPLESVSASMVGNFTSDMSEESLLTRISDIRAIWERVLSSLQQKLKYKATFLHGAVHLWDTHFHRVQDLDALIMKELGKVISFNDKDIHTQDHFKIEDKLRQEPTEEKLENTFNVVQTSTEFIQDGLKAHYDAEVAIIEKYPQLRDKEIEILLEELKNFLQSSNISLETSRDASAISLALYDGESNFIPAQMKMCDFQVIAIKNWMLGLWEAINKYALSCRDEIAGVTQEWVERGKKKLFNRYEIKTALRKPRLWKIKADIYDIRLAEIRYHASRLREHKNGVERELKQLSEGLPISFELECKNIIECYNTETTKLFEKVKDPKLARQVQTVINEVQKLSKKHVKLIDEKYQEYEKNVHGKVEEAKRAGIEFCKSMRLFSEGGNYHIDEAKLASKELRLLAKKVVKRQSKAALKALKKQYKKIQRPFEKHQTEGTSRLQKLLEELTFGESSSKLLKSLEAALRRTVNQFKFSVGQALTRWEKTKNRGLANANLLPQYLEFFFEHFKDVCTKFTQFQKSLLGDVSDVNPGVSKLSVISVRTSSSTGTTNSKKGKSKSSKSSNSSITLKSKKSNKKPLKSSASTKSKKSSKKSSKSTKSSTSSKGSSSAESSRSSRSSKSLSGYLNAKIIFGTKPKDTDHLLSKLVKIMYECLEEIENKAKDFYAKHKKFALTKVQPSIREFMEDIAKKMNSYREQCSTVCVDLAKSVADIVADQKKFLPLYANTCITTNYQRHMKICRDYAFNKEKKMTELLNKNEEAFMKVYEKFKPLHGHPQNRHLLEELENEMAEVITRRENNVLAIFIPIEKELDSLRQNFLLDMTNTVDKLMNHCESPEILENFDTLDRLKEFLDKATPEIGHNTPIAGGSCNDFEMQLKGKPDGSFKDSSNCLLCNKSMSMCFCDLVNKKLNALGTCQEKPDLEELIQQYEAEFTSHLQKCNTIKVKAEEADLNLTEVWKMEVERVLKLYKVKYEQQ